MPMVQPSSQLFGSGFGHSGSTSKIGACTVEPWASARFCNTAWPIPRPRMPAASAVPHTNLRSRNNLIMVPPCPDLSIVEAIIVKSGELGIEPSCGFCRWQARARLPGESRAHKFAHNPSGGGHMKRAPFSISIAAAIVVSGYAAGWGGWAPAIPRATVSSTMEPVWTEAKWPFLQDQWGIGKAVVCMPADCGVKVDVFIRPKIGFCNCSTGVSDDKEQERAADTDLVSPQVRPLGPASPVKVGWMRGLSPAYLTSNEKPNEHLPSVSFNDEFDVV